MKRMTLYTTSGRKVVIKDLTDITAKRIDTTISDAWAQERSGSISANVCGRFIRLNIDTISHYEIS